MNTGPEHRGNKKSPESWERLFIQKCKIDVETTKWESCRLLITLFIELFRHRKFPEFPEKFQKVSDILFFRKSYNPNYYYYLLLVYYIQMRDDDDDDDDDDTTTTLVRLWGSDSFSTMALYKSI